MRGTLNVQRTGKDTSQVDEAERKVAHVLDELEQATDGEVKGLNLEEVVDSDANGRPIVKKAVDIRVQRTPKKQWL